MPIERYQPSEEEVNRAEEMMSDDQKEASELREWLIKLEYKPTSTSLETTAPALEMRLIKDKSEVLSNEVIFSNSDGMYALSGLAKITYEELKRQEFVFSLYKFNEASFSVHGKGKKRDS